ncbi:MAG TPA: glycosyltransferase family 4 protein [Solirubrobacteraceae bacterium]|nr:glycosyltransferase family 4 protein [Solirubrobacteraceae bacterium]
MRERSAIAAGEAASVAYVLKAYPRLSETYIHSEIHRLERLGLPLRLYSIKPVEGSEQGPRHPVVDRIRAQPVYLPEVGSVSGVSATRWLRGNVRPFLSPLARCLRRHPAGLCKAALAALAQAVRARPRWSSAPRKIYLKEFLQAVALSDHVSAAPDVRHLHAHYAHGSTTVAWLVSQITGLPFSFTAHAKDVYSEDLNPAGLLRRKLLAARFAVTCTEAGAKHMRRLAPEARIHVVYHGLVEDLSQALDDGARTARPNGAMRMLGVGRLVAKKGFDTFVDACAALQSDGVPFEATIAGPDGPYGRVVRELIVARGLEDRIHLAGAMSQDELLSEYVRADAFCLPCRIVGSDRDGIPNVLVEAMAAGTPVVSTCISGIPELIKPGVNGLLVPPDDPVALAGALRTLHTDPAFAARLASAGRATVRERFDGERLAQQLADLFLAELDR